MEWLDPQDFSKHLRKAMTPAEYLLWQLIRNRQRCNAKFRRQYAKGVYLLDFYCPEAKLCVECDGLPHFTPEGIEKDRIRTQWLKLQGIEVIRFTSQDIEQDTQRVPRDIDNCFETVTQTGITSSSPNPFSSDDRGEGELKPRAHLIVLSPPSPPEDPEEEKGRIRISKPRPTRNATAKPFPRWLVNSCKRIA